MLKSLLPHDIVVRRPDGTEITIPPSGTVARVSVTQEVVGEIDGVPVVQNRYGDVTGLPDPEPGVTFIVSGLVLSRCPDRQDLVAPDTGPTAIRDEGGHIVAVVRFTKGA